MNVPADFSQESLTNMEVPDDFSLEFEIRRLLGFDEEEQTKEDPKNLINYDAASERFKCLKCDSTFKRFDTGTSHVSAVHFGKRFTCNFCPKVFTIKANMKEHTRSIHLGMKSKCKLC